jgi:hypothetical protein
MTGGTPDVWAAIALVVMGGILGGAAYQTARARDPDPRYASRAARVSLWLTALGLISTGLSAILGKRFLNVALVLLILACAWQVMLLLSTIVAPTWAARIWVHAYDVADATGSARPVPTFKDSVEEARGMGRLLVVVALLIWAGYWVASRWLGIWLLPVGFLIVLVVGILKTFRPHVGGARRALGTH